MRTNSGLSFQTRKALSVQIGETPAAELAEILQRMAAQIDELKRTKVNVTRVVPVSSEPRFSFDSTDLSHSADNDLA